MAEAEENRPAIQQNVRTGIPEARPGPQMCSVEPVWCLKEKKKRIARQTLKIRKFHIKILHYSFDWKTGKSANAGCNSGLTAWEWAGEAAASRRESRKRYICWWAVLPA